MAALEEQLGLKNPPPVQYVLWMKELGKGNLGVFISSRKPVTE